MATVTTWTGVSVSIQSALATAVTISGITKADPGVVTHASGAQSDGAFIVLDVEGMTQLDGRVFRVDNPTSTTLGSRTKHDLLDVFVRVVSGNHVPGRHSRRRPG
ncbi:MAG: hypothetical protein IPH07_24735 [Deltaproteobacteria bacterium]|nr:hypothetical protein [Deltaproteobacteria bacterium]